MPNPNIVRVFSESLGIDSAEYKNINVYRQCLDCGYERHEPEEVKIDENDRRTSCGFIVCPKCKGRNFALVGYRDKGRD